MKQGISKDIRNKYSFINMYMMKLLIISICSLLYVKSYAQTDTLTLANAIGTALENNYGIIIQERSYDISQINNTLGNAGGLPAIYFTGNGSETCNFNEADDSQVSSYNSSVNLDWVIFRGFAAKIQKSRLDEFERFSEINLALVTENTVIDVTLTYYRAVLQFENMKAAQEIMELSEDRYYKEKLKKEQGSAKSYDVLQSQNAWLEDKSNYLTARTNFHNSVRQLNYLMALPIETFYELSESFTIDTNSFDLDTLTGKMLSNNFTLRNQYINMEMAKLDVRSARSAYYPVITTGVGSGYNSYNSDYGTNSLLNQDNRGYSTSISAGISYSIYEGGQRKQVLKAAKIEEEISQLETKQLEDDLKNRLAQEFELYKVRKELLKVAEENIKASRLNLEISTQKYESGVINSFNFRDVQQTYTYSVWNYHNIIFDTIESYNKLLQLTGGIIEEFNN